jgi:hypothetical protein
VVASLTTTEVIHVLGLTKIKTCPQHSTTQHSTAQHSTALSCCSERWCCY